jgi:hypothetical protein
VGSIGADVTFKLSFNPLSENIISSKTDIQTAINSLPGNLESFSSYICEARVFSGLTERTTPFLIPIMIEVFYHDSDQDGIVDNSNPLIFEHKLHGYYLDSQAWRLAPDQDQDHAQNSVAFYLTSLGSIALLGDVNYSNNADEVKIYPNPYKPGSRGSFDSTGITFDRIPLDATLRILNLNGEFIKEIKENDTDGRIIWNAKNTNGADVVTGLYLAIMEGKTDKKIYKFAIER